MSALEIDHKTHLKMMSIATLSQRGRWYTEAMRSYSTARLIWITRGQGRITIAGTTRGYGPNNLIYVPANTMHGFETSAHVQGQIITLPSYATGVWPNQPVHIRLRDVRVQGELSGLLENLQRELISDRLAAAEAAEYHAALLSVFFARQQIEAPDTTQPDTASARLASAFTSLIESDFKSTKTVADYASDLGVTPTHLTRCCKQTCGRSALSILNERILFEARLQLLQSRKPIKDIADELGFSSAAYFTRAFQEQTGQTPTEFRKLR